MQEDLQVAETDTDAEEEDSLVHVVNTNILEEDKEAPDSYTDVQEENSQTLETVCSVQETESHIEDIETNVHEEEPHIQETGFDVLQANVLAHKTEKSVSEDESQADVAETDVLEDDSRPGESQAGVIEDESRPGDSQAGVIEDVSRPIDTETEVLEDTIRNEETVAAMLEDESQQGVTEADVPEDDSQAEEQSEEEAFQSRQTGIAAPDTETDVVEEGAQYGKSKIEGIEREVHGAKATAEAQEIESLASETESEHKVNTLNEYVRMHNEEESAVESDEGKFQQQARTHPLDDDIRGRQTDTAIVEEDVQTEIEDANKDMTVITYSSLEILSHCVSAQDGYQAAPVQSVDETCANVLSPGATSADSVIKEDGEHRVLKWLNTLSECGEVKTSEGEATPVNNLSRTSTCEVEDTGLSTYTSLATSAVGVTTNNVTLVHSHIGHFFESFADDNDIDFAEGVVEASSSRQSVIRTHEDSRTEIINLSDSDITQTIQHQRDDQGRKKSSRDGYHDMLEVFGISDDISSRGLGLGKDRHQPSTSSIESLESIDPDVVKMLEAYGMVNSQASTEEIKVECSTNPDLDSLLTRPESPTSIGDDSGPEEWRSERSETYSRHQYFQAFAESFLPMNEIELGDANAGEIREARNTSPEAVFPSDTRPEEASANTATLCDNSMVHSDITALQSHSMEDDGSSFDFTGMEPLSGAIEQEQAGSRGTGTKEERQGREQEEAEEEEEEEEEQQYRHQQQQQEKGAEGEREQGEQEQGEQKQTELHEQQHKEQLYEHVQIPEDSKHVEDGEEKGEYKRDEQEEEEDVEIEEDKTEGEELTQHKKNTEDYPEDMKSLTAEAGGQYHALTKDKEQDEKNQQTQQSVSETSQHEMTRYTLADSHEEQSLDGSSRASLEYLHKSTSKHVSFYHSVESDEDTPSEPPRLTSVRKTETRAFYTVDNSQYEEMYYDASDFLGRSSTQELCLHQGSLHQFNDSFLDKSELSATDHSRFISSKELSSTISRTDLSEGANSSVHEIDHVNAIDHKEYKLESSDVDQISEALTFIDRKEHRLDHGRAKRSIYELRTSFSSENDIDTSGEDNGIEPADTLTKHADINTETQTSSSTLEAAESVRCSEVLVCGICPLESSQPDGFYDEITDIEHSVCAEISIDSDRKIQGIDSKTDAGSLSTYASTDKYGVSSLSVKADSEAAEFHSGRHLEEIAARQSKLFPDKNSAETDATVVENSNANTYSEAQTDEELFISEETADSQQLDEDEVFSSTKFSTSQSAPAVAHPDTPLTTDGEDTSVSADSIYSTCFETDVQTRPEEQAGAAEDDDYTTQLAEVHSVMAGLSRRVSCDVDLCHLDVIGAIDTLVEKMAFELQQGTLSAADIMQEISNLTSGRPRFGISESNPPSLRESREGSPGVATRPIARTHSVRSGEATAQIEESADSSSLKREQLEMQIYDILDEIMTLLGTVSKQRSISISDSQSEESVNVGFGIDDTDVAIKQSIADERIVGHVGTGEEAHNQSSVDGSIDGNETQLEEYTSRLASAVHMEDIEVSLDVPFNSPMDRSLNLTTSQTFDEGLECHTSPSYGTLDRLIIGEQLDVTNGKPTELNNEILITGNDLFMTDQPGMIDSDILNTENQPGVNNSEICTKLGSPKDIESSFEEVNVETEMSGLDSNETTSNKDKTLDCVSESNVVTDIFANRRLPFEDIQRVRTDEVEELSAVTEQAEVSGYDSDSFRFVAHDGKYQELLAYQIRTCVFKSENSEGQHETESIEIRTTCEALSDCLRHTEPGVGHMHTDAQKEETVFMRETCHDHDGRVLESFSHELASKINEDALGAGEVSDVIALGTSDDEFDIIDMSEVETTETQINVSDTGEKALVSHSGQSNEFVAEQQVLNQATMSSTVCDTDDTNTSADGDHSVLFKLQTLYYVNQQENELCPGTKSLQHDADSGKSEPESDEHKALQSSDVASEADESDIGVHETSEIPDITAKGEESKDQDGHYVSLSNSAYSNDITDLSKSQEQMQSSFDERLADELAENIVNEVLASQEQQYRLADTLKTLQNIPEDVEGVDTEPWGSSLVSSHAHSASAAEIEKCPSVSFADYSSLHQLERDARSAPFSEEDFVLSSTSLTNNDFYTRTDVCMSASSVHNASLTVLSEPGPTTDDLHRELAAAGQDRYCVSVLSVDAADHMEYNTPSTLEQPSTFGHDYAKTIQDGQEHDDIVVDETDEDSQFADFDDSDSEFETVEFRERLQEEVASAISKEIVLMAEVEVAMEDLTNTKDILYSPTEEIASTEGFHLSDSTISNHECKIHEVAATSVTCMVEESKPEVEQGPDPGYDGKESYHDALAGGAGAEDTATLQAMESTKAYSEERIPSLYERSLSAKLSRAISDDPAKWHHLFVGEYDQGTTDIADVCVWGDDERCSSTHLDEQSIPLEHREFEDEVLPRVKPAHKNEHIDISLEDYSSDEDESLDRTEQEYVFNGQQNTSPDKETTLEETSSTILEIHRQHKHEISKSKRRRLQRLRRKHAECSVSSSLELPSDTHSSMDTQEMQGDDVAHQHDKAQTYKEFQSSVSTDSSPETRYKYAERKEQSFGSLDDITTEEQVYALHDVTEELRQSRKSQKKPGDCRFPLLDTENALTTVPRNKVPNSEDEKNIFQQSGLHIYDTDKYPEPTGRRDWQKTGDAASGSTMPVFQISSSDINQGTLQDEPTTEQAEAVGLHPNRSAAGRPRSRSRSKSPAPPNLRRITGQPQRRRPRKNIVVVSNPHKF